MLKKENRLFEKILACRRCEHKYHTITLKEIKAGNIEVIIDCKSCSYPTRKVLQTSERDDIPGVIDRLIRIWNEHNGKMLRLQDLGVNTRFTFRHIGGYYITAWESRGGVMNRKYINLCNGEVFNTEEESDILQSEVVLVSKSLIITDHIVIEQLDN